MGGRFALVIATDTFEDNGLRKLLSPQADAAALAQVLTDPGIGQFEVRSLVNEPSYRVNRMAEAFFNGRRRDDLVLVYYTGHGVKDQSGQLYFAMPDTDMALLGSTALSARFLTDLMTSSRSGTKVLLLDCCHSGAFARGMTGKADKAVHTAERFAGRGRVVLTASDAMQYAFEGDDLTGQGVRSFFTRFLVEGLSTGQADQNGDGEIDVDELFEYIFERVTTETPTQQPRKWAWDVAGRVVIARSQVARTDLPSDLQSALESSFVGVRLAAVKELGLLLRSDNVRLAEAAMIALRSCTDDDSKQVSGAAAGLLAGSSSAPPATERPPAPARPASAPQAASHSTPAGARRPALAPGMIPIPAGPYFGGLTNDQIRSIKSGRPSWSDIGSEIQLPAFQIAKFPVTNREYARFLAATRRLPPRHWDSYEPTDQLLDHPVTWVNWAAANAYCEWLRAETGLPYRLPTAQEWEKAARGPDRRWFPWGDQFDPSRCHFRSRSTVPVTKHVPAGDSPYQVSDMAGNAREWTSTFTGTSSPTMVVRGGGFLARSEHELWCAFKDEITGAAKASIGFRVAITQD
jgi:formylglycine-generating enzyme required for sulfatase activity